MELALDILSWICLLGGTAFVLIGGIGVLRLPDLYTRMHAAGLTDTMGTLLILLGLMVQAGFSLATVKLALILIFLLFTSPTASYALANTAMSAGVKPKLAGPSPETPVVSETPETPGASDGGEGRPE